MRVDVFASTDRPKPREERGAFWTELDSTMGQVLNDDHLLDLIDAHVRTRLRVRKKRGVMMGTYGTDARTSDNNETASL